MTNDPNMQMGIENLIVGHFDGTLNEEQEKQLATALADSEDAKQLFLSYMRMEGRLHSLGRDGFLREPAAESVTETEQAATQTTGAGPIVRSGRKRFRLFAASSVAVCAAVMLMLTSGILSPSYVNASGVLERAQAAAAELIDRTYRVTLSSAGAPSPTSELTINVRGGGRFLVRPADGAFAMGSDGTEYWVTRASGPVWVTGDSRTLAPRVRRTIPNMWLFGIAASPNEPLLLDMAGLLALIERKHDIELIDSANFAEHHVRATLRRGRRNAPPNAPERIDFWADAKSGVGLQAEVSWANGRRMKFELLESAPLSDGWYHYSEHAPDGEVRHLPTKDRP